MNFHDRLISAFTQYDERESGKKNWNPRALGIYFERAEEIAKDVRRGAGEREAIVAGLNGSLLSYVLRKMKLPPPTRDEFTGAGKMLYRPVRGNPPFYAHNLYEKKTHGLTLHQMRRLYRMVSAGNQKAITYARNVLGIPFSESPTQVKAVVYHHVRDLAERKMRRNGRRAFPTPRFVGKGAHVWRQLRPSQRMNFLYTHFTPQITPRSQEILAGRSFQFLPKNVKMAVEAKYANMEPEEYLRENPLTEDERYHLGRISRDPYLRRHFTGFTRKRKKVRRKKR